MATLTLGLRSFRSKDAARAEIRRMAKDFPGAYLVPV